MTDILERLRAPFAVTDQDAQEAVVEIERLRDETARYKLIYQKYVEATDRMNGTPCEQIRHEQQVEALREENARLRGILKECADGLEDAVNSQYGEMARRVMPDRYERDMQSVVKARAALAVAEPVIREQCAIECERRATTVGNGKDEYALACRHTAAAIREGQAR